MVHAVRRTSNTRGGPLRHRVTPQRLSWCSLPITTSTRLEAYETVARRCPHADKSCELRDLAAKLRGANAWCEVEAPPRDLDATGLTALTGCHREWRPSYSIGCAVGNQGRLSSRSGLHRPPARSRLRARGLLVLLLTVRQAHPRPSAVPVDEVDVGRFHCIFAGRWVCSAKTSLFPTE